MQPLSPAHTCTQTAHAHTRSHTHKARAPNADRNPTGGMLGRTGTENPIQEGSRAINHMALSLSQSTSEMSHMEAKLCRAENPVTLGKITIQGPNRPSSNLFSQIFKIYYPKVFSELIFFPSIIFGSSLKRKV